MTDLKLAIGIPTINRADLLQEALADLAINLPDLDKLFIVDNGSQEFCIPENIQGKTIVHRPGKNLGVAGSWNYMMRSAFIEHGIDYLFLLNDDIVLGKTKQTILETITRNPEARLISGGYYWSAIMLRKDIVDSVGYFDETFYPAYYEDDDFSYRCSILQIPMVTDTALSPSVKRSSETIKKDRTLEGGSHKNHLYYIKKWGGDCHKEKFNVPFNGNPPK